MLGNPFLLRAFWLAVLAAAVLACTAQAQTASSSPSIALVVLATRELAAKLNAPVAVGGAGQVAPCLTADAGEILVLALPRDEGGAPEWFRVTSGNSYLLRPLVGQMALVTGQWAWVDGPSNIAGDVHVTGVAPFARFFPAEALEGDEVGDLSGEDLNSPFR